MNSSILKTRIRYLVISSKHGASYVFPKIVMSNFVLALYVSGDVDKWRAISEISVTTYNNITYRLTAYIRPGPLLGRAAHVAMAISSR